MNFTAIFCCYVLLPYFASLVFPPQEAITCNAGIFEFLKSSSSKIQSLLPESEEASSEEQLEDKILITSGANSINNFFEQKCDHYHFNNLNTWQQRYLIYDNHYDGKGVIFLRIGADNDIDNWHMQNGRWFEYCKEAKAMCIGIELRGYGVSLPHGNLKNDNLKYINSDQALADVAWFIYNFRDLKMSHKLPNKLKWVVYGNSIQGTLAVWLRMKFPHLVHAVLSLSAPVSALMDYKDYFKFISSEMKNKERNLFDQLESAYSEIRKLLDKKKYEKIAKLFNLCDVSLMDELSYRYKNSEFMYFIFSHTVATIMQYSDGDMASMKNKMSNIMLNNKKRYKKFNSPIERFAEVIKRMLKKYKKECVQVNYQVAVRKYIETTGSKYDSLDFLLPKIFGNRASLYQHCNEFGLFETYEYFLGTTRNRLEFYTRFCRDVFIYEDQSSEGALKTGVLRTNVFYGGFNIVVSRVIFVYGSKDPYRHSGMIYGHPPNTEVYFLEDAWTCTELDNYKFTKSEHDKRNAIYLRLLDWLN